MKKDLEAQGRIPVYAPSRIPARFLCLASVFFPCFTGLLVRRTLLLPRLVAQAPQAAAGGRVAAGLLLVAHAPHGGRVAAER